MSKLFEDFEKPSFQDWLEEVKNSVKNPEDLKKLIHTTDDGIQLNSLYTNNDLQEIPHYGAEPGEFPYTSGFRYKNGWKIIQTIECEKIMLANQAALICLKNGTDGILFTGDFFPQENELKIIFKDIYLDACPLHFDFGESNNSFLYVLIDELSQRGVKLEEVTGSVNFDPYQRILLTGVFEYGKFELKNLLAQQIKYAQSQLPNFKSLAINARMYHNSGASDAVEMGVSMAHFVQYLDYLTDANLTVDEVVAQTIFHISTSTDYLSSISKLRAYRILIANILDAYKNGEEILTFPELMVHDSQWSKTFLDTHNNILRATTQAMSAIIGGADAVAISAYNNAKSLPKSDDYVLAKNIQLLLREESKFDFVQDPAAGSYFIENFTQKLADKAWEIFKQIEKQGGFEKAFEDKYIQSLIESSASSKNEEIINQKKIIVGVNKYPNKNEVIPNQLEKPIIERFVESAPQIMPVVPYRASEKIEQTRFLREKEGIADKQ